MFSFASSAKGTERRSSRTRLSFSLAVLTLFALLLSACSSGTSSTSASSDTHQSASQGDPAGSADSAERSSAFTAAKEKLVKNAVADPKSLKGTATAASVPEVQPISDPQSPQLPVTVTDHQGTEVTVQSAERILALDLYGTLADTVIALGLGDHLVGRVTSNTQASLANLPLVTTGGHDLNAEAILSLAPTLVLMDTTNGPVEITEQLRSAGVTVVHFDPQRSMDQVVPQINKVAQALGVPESGKRLAERVQLELDEAIAAIAQAAPADEAQKVKMAFLYVRGTAGVFFILGDGSGADDLITALSGVDVASASGAKKTTPASSEALVKVNPDLILTMTDGIKSTGGLEGFLARPGVTQTNAGANQRIVDMAGGQVLSFGPNTPAVLLSLATAIYTEGA